MTYFGTMVLPLDSPLLDRKVQLFESLELTQDNIYTWGTSEADFYLSMEI